MRIRRAHRPGFTLIEVLVVVAIIALLVAILLPSLRNARYLAWRSVCFHNLNQIGIGMVAYALQNKELLPLCRQVPDKGPLRYINAPPDNPEPKSYYGVGRDDMSALFPRYIKDTKVWECPGARNVVRRREDLVDNYRPEDNPRIGSAYEYNPFMFQLVRSPPDKRLFWDEGPNGRLSLLKWSRLKQMSNVTIAHDTDDSNSLLGSQNVIVDYGDPHYEMKGGNMLCADGHARWVRQEDWWNATDAGRPIVP
ncbi:MAG: type II secretion system protein [Phycisphaerae bacterium]|jgi:prepilin-type N-terminal cleavage/methylation domain-containing protein